MAYSKEQIGETNLRPVNKQTKGRYNMYVRQENGTFVCIASGSDWPRCNRKAREMIKNGVDWRDIFADITPHGVEHEAGKHTGTDHTWGNALHHLFVTADNLPLSPQ